MLDHLFREGLWNIIAMQWKEVGAALINPSPVGYALNVLHGSLIEDYPISICSVKYVLRCLVVVALALFIRLEAAMSHIVSMKLPIQEHFFDLTIGASSDYFYSFAADSQYRAESIEEALKGAFSTEQDTCTRDNN
ncbi:hypothetical protein C7212DRAFT_343005 [Tuber magnatum]|uniref:Uncharacterized protein n=1 Tax=Tuber magnatum TaxID=42249 RepID=A0A317SS56_9PEZI|nr:hypothetical protein C7212DRAFT_343005 [Tuber magnatum]